MKANILLISLGFMLLLFPHDQERDASGMSADPGFWLNDSGSDTSLEQGIFAVLRDYNIAWKSQSSNSSESMPCGGGDIGLNVWVEDGDILFYLSRSGSFDENNTFLKLGRIRIQLSPNPFNHGEFLQELVLKDGRVIIEGKNRALSSRVSIWVDVFNPVIHVEISGNKKIAASVIYENWRYRDRLLRKKESLANSYKWAPPDSLTAPADKFGFHGNGVLFYHRNADSTIFDVTVHQQGMDSVRSEMVNPLKNLTFGGYLEGENMVPSGTIRGSYAGTDFSGRVLKSVSDTFSHRINIYLHTAQTESLEEWQEGLEKKINEPSLKSKLAEKRSLEWWNKFWQRSFIAVNPTGKDASLPSWQSGRNYQLFRYMLACNAYGEYPTKFNGGLFTYDPCYVDTSFCFTPDFRNWGGGTMTAQNQRLVYFPMIKSGDFDFLESQFRFYLRSLKNAELRSKVYWGHEGACFTEQLENFGLPNCSEYGWDRPEYYDEGMQYNAWLEYQWDTVLEFCLMMLETERYFDKNIREYLPFINSCLTFFDQHYLYLAKKRGRHKLDKNGHLVLYPGSACETYKMTYNSVTTISALKTILSRLLELPVKCSDESQRSYWRSLLDRIPSLPYRNVGGYTTIAPAEHWERVNNTEVPQLYPVFPWGIFGIGKPHLDTAINTWKHDPDAKKFRGYTGWKQDNIFAARLGMADIASRLTFSKLQDSGRRFPAFWGPGFDWVPDHNQGGSGMIGLQEMLLQTDGRKIFLFPAWPADTDVYFKLHAPYNTVVEGRVENAKVTEIKVSPKEREKDIINMFGEKSDE